MFGVVYISVITSFQFYLRLVLNSIWYVEVMDVLFLNAIIVIVKFIVWMALNFVMDIVAIIEWF